MAVVKLTTKEEQQILNDVIVGPTVAEETTRSIKALNKELEDLKTMVFRMRSQASFDTRTHYAENIKHTIQSMQLDMEELEHFCGIIDPIELTRGEADLILVLCRQVLTDCKTPHARSTAHKLRHQLLPKFAAKGVTQ